MEAHGVERNKRAAILAPQLTGKARLAYAAMSDEAAQDYDRVKAAIFQRYDINEETYRRRFRAVKPKENETPIELVIRVRDLAEKWLKECANRQAVVDALVKEQFVEVLPEEVKVWVKERKPELVRKPGDWLKITGKPEKQSCGPQAPRGEDKRFVIHVGNLDIWLEIAANRRLHHRHSQKERTCLK